MPFFLGLDCGGSTTRAIVIDEHEKVVFQGIGGSANLSSTPLDVLRNSLMDALLGVPEVDAVAGCFAGLLGETQRVTAVEFLKSATNCQAICAYADYVAALAAAPKGIDMVVIAGTGSVICSWSNGEPVKSGGGGPLLGDRGSAFDIGRTAVQYLCLWDREIQATEAFWSAVEQLFGTRSREELPAAIGSNPQAVSLLAQLAPVVGADFESETYAKGSIQYCLGVLGNDIQLHCSRFHKRKRTFKLALSGGLWQAHPVFQQSLTKFLNYVPKSDLTGTKRRQYHVERLEAPPVLGAARLAKNLFYGH